MRLMRGKIKAIFEKEKTYGITLNGNDWYVGFISDKPDWLVKGESEGTEVEFEYTKHKSGDREYNNIVKGSLRRVEDKQNISYGDSQVKEKIEELSRQIMQLSRQLQVKAQRDEETRKDIRLSVCLKAGIDFVNTLLIPDDLKGSTEEMLQLVVYCAKEFEKYFENEKA